MRHSLSSRTLPRSSANRLMAFLIFSAFFAAALMIPAFAYLAPALLATVTLGSVFAVIGVGMGCIALGVMFGALVTFSTAVQEPLVINRAIQTRPLTATPSIGLTSRGNVVEQSKEHKSTATRTPTTAPTTTPSIGLTSRGNVVEYSKEHKSTATRTPTTAPICPISSSNNLNAKPSRTTSFFKEQTTRSANSHPPFPTDKTVLHSTNTGIPLQPETKEVSHFNSR